MTEEQFRNVLRDSLRIRPAVVPDEIPVVRELFREYADGLGVDLCFQGFEAELAGLPGAYAPPSGRLLLAVQGESVLGCVGLRRLSDADAEMKRLYVRPAARGRGLGWALVSALVVEATAIGYRRVLLDTLPTMADAIRLYESVGFRPVEPYCRNPIPGARYLGLDLRPTPQPERTMANENEAKARRWFEEVWNQRKTETAREMVAPDGVCHSEGGPIRGADEFLERGHTPMLAALPDLRLTVEGTVSEGDQVVVRWVATGTHTGPGFGGPPSGKKVRVRGMTWIRYADGKMAEGWDCWNLSGLIQTLQGGPPPPSVAVE